MAESTVRFNFWTVLICLILAAVGGFTFLYADGEKTKAKQQDVIQRVLVLETNYANIIKGLDKLTLVVEKSVEEYRKNTEKRNTKSD